MKKLQSLRQQYKVVEIPIELNSVLRKSIQKVKKERQYKRSVKGLGVVAIAESSHLKFRLIFFGSYSLVITISTNFLI